MVKINTYTYPVVDLYSPEGQFLGVLSNPVEFADIRLQIAKNSLEGYYIMHENEKYFIDKYGKMEWGRFGVFDAEMDVISELLQVGIDNYKKNKK